MERRFRLALDLLYGDTVGNLDEGQSLGEVDIKYTLFL
jgi:hypothetical protein